jgi:hypothetical protein
MVFPGKIIANIPKTKSKMTATKRIPPEMIVKYHKESSANLSFTHRGEVPFGLEGENCQ